MSFFRHSHRLFRFSSTLVYAFTSIALWLISLSMIAYALWEVWIAVHVGQSMIGKMLDAVGLMVISMAVFDVSKYLMEEEVFRAQRELSSPREARRTLTKFLVIIIIAVNLEAVVFIFGAGTSDIKTLVFPTLLLIAAVLLIIGLGWYQRLTLNTEQYVSHKSSANDEGDAPATSTNR